MKRVALRRRDGSTQTYLWAHVLLMRAWKRRVRGAWRVLRGTHRARAKEMDQ